MVNFIVAFLVIFIGVRLIKMQNLSWWHLVGIIFLGLIWDALLVCDIFKPKKNEDNGVQLLED